MKIFKFLFVALAMLILQSFTTSVKASDDFVKEHRAEVIKKVSLNTVFVGVDLDRMCGYGIAGEYLYLDLYISKQVYKPYIIRYKENSRSLQIFAYTHPIDLK